MSVEEFLKASKRKSKRETTIKEKPVEDQFCDYALSKGCKAFKLIMLNKRGFPDRTVICPNAKVFFIEFKRKGEVVKGLQSKVRDLLERYGFEYYSCDDIDSAKSILDKFLNYDNS